MNASAPLGTAEQIAARPGADSGRALFWRMIWIYHVASFVAVAVVLFLATLGLEFTSRQWLIFWGSTPPGVAFYTLLDVIVIRRHLKPLAPVLSALDRGERPDEATLGRALVRALNLPQYSAMRVMLLHGPAATFALIVLISLLNGWFDVGIATWQFVWLAATVFLFATPTHAIFEFFAVSKTIEPIAIRLSKVLDGPIPAEAAKDLIAVPLRNKVLFLAIFCCSLPLGFVAVSFLHKFERIVGKNMLMIPPGDIQALYLYIGGVVLVCIAGAVSMAVLTAREVSHSAARLVDAMRHVERGNLGDEAELEVLTTDEYAEINRGFGLMLDSLREEHRLLEVTQDLAGELLLEALIGRIMTATTELLNAERASLFLYDEKADELFSLYADGLERVQIRVPTSAGIAGAVFTSGKTENIADPYADPRFNQDVDRRTGFTTRSILCVPITSKAGARIGVAQALNKRGGTFTAKDEQRLKAFAAQIAVSLENAKLFDDVLSIKNYNESILQSTSNGIVTVDGEDRVVTANDPALALLGLAREAVVGRDAGELFAGPNGWIVERLEKTQTTGESQLAMDAEVTRGDGATASVNLTTLPLRDADNAQIGSMLVLEDITEEKRVRSTMSRYMSKEVADQLLSAGELELGGTEQKVTVMFSDVRQFTSIAEALGPRDTVSLLNEYFTEMVDVIFQHGGILDKYMGDGIMALFGAPIVGPNDADNALAAADDMMGRLAALNVRRKSAGQEPLAIGIGFSTGPTVVGNIGSARRLEYTVIGDTVNLASRLEGATKQYGARVMMSEFTVRDLTRPATLRELDLIRVRGKDRPVAVYESLGYRAGEPKLGDLLELHAVGVKAYRARDWKAAEAAFREALKLYPDDGPAGVYVNRCRLLAETPPPDDWDGVWNLTEK